MNCKSSKNNLLSPGEGQRSFGWYSAYALFIDNIIFARPRQYFIRWLHGLAENICTYLH